jgi:catechol 2,3-dioxygenase-like lactoylglutathione lyase family enzyme
MITGAHTLIYTEDPEGLRAFLRDVLGFGNVDAGGGWLIFRSPPAEVAVHPGPDRHELSLMCDDLAATMAELTAKGVRFTSEPSEQPWGTIVQFSIPGGGELSLYEPKHPVAYGLPG